MIISYIHKDRIVVAQGVLEDVLDVLAYVALEFLDVFAPFVVLEFVPYVALAVEDSTLP